MLYCHFVDVLFKYENLMVRWKKNKVKQTRSSFHCLRLTPNEICVRLNKKKTWRQNGIHCDGCLENLASHLIHSKEKAEFCQCSHALIALGTHKCYRFSLWLSQQILGLFWAKMTFYWKLINWMEWQFTSYQVQNWTIILPKQKAIYFAL